MSILIVGAAGAVGEALIARFVEQGDQVRVIEPDEPSARRWRALGAHVARGTPMDDDLVSRAALGARTVVLLSGALPIPALLAAARLGGVGRAVVCALEGEDTSSVEEAGMEYVILRLPRSRLRSRRSVTPAAVADAIEAADDLSEVPAGLDVEISRLTGGGSS